MMGSRIIRVDSEVKRLLDEERQPTERNYNGAIIRLIERAGERDEQPTARIVSQSTRRVYD